MVAASALVLLAVAAAPPPDAQQIVRQAMDREIHHRRNLDNYTWQEETVVRRVDKSPQSKTWDHFQIDGSSYKKLVARNGKPLSDSDARKEQANMDKEIAKRRNEPPAQRDKRRKAEEKEKAEGIKFREEVLRAFDFKLEGEETVAGVAAWRVAGTPRPGFKPTSRDGKVLPKLRGHLWIGQQSGEWLKFDIETLDKITFGAFLVSVGSGARISSEQMRVNDELWHPRYERIRINARALFIKFNAEIENTYRNFQRFSAESRIVETGDAIR